MQIDTTMGSFQVEVRLRRAVCGSPARSGLRLPPPALAVHITGAQLYYKHAPKTVKNFEELARRGYYDGTQVRGARAPERHDAARAAWACGTWGCTTQHATSHACMRGDGGAVVGARSSARKQRSRRCMRQAAPGAHSATACRRCEGACRRCEGAGKRGRARASRFRHHGPHDRGLRCPMRGPRPTACCWRLTPCGRARCRAVLLLCLSLRSAAWGCRVCVVCRPCTAVPRPPRCCPAWCAQLHRIIRDFMIQGGDPTGTGRGGESIYGEHATHAHPARHASRLTARTMANNSMRWRSCTS